MKRRPERPSRKATLAAFNAFRPLDQDAKPAPKRARRKAVEEGLGGTDFEEEKE